MMGNYMSSSPPFFMDMHLGVLANGQKGGYNFEGYWSSMQPRGNIHRNDAVFTIQIYY